MLTAADRVLAAQGAEAVTTTTVAAEAGVAVGSVYRYLPHRGAILHALATRYLDRLVLELESFTVPDDADEAEIIGRLIDRFSDFYRSHPGFRALWLSRSLTPDTQAADRAHKRVMAAQIMRFLVDRGVCAPDAPPAIATTIHLSADALMQEAFRVDPEGDPSLLTEAKRLITSYIDAVAATGRRSPAQLR
jgi:AcrR family transcriptional regulator